MLPVRGQALAGDPPRTAWGAAPPGTDTVRAPGPSEHVRLEIDHAVHLAHRPSDPPLRMEAIARHVRGLLAEATP